MFNTAGRVSFESGKVGENGLQNHPAMMLRHGLVSFLLHSVLVLGFTYTMFDFGNSIAQGNLKTNLLAKMAATINGPRNACRNLTRLIKRTPGATLRIPIDVCKVTIALRKPKRALQIYWPMIKLAEWCKYLLEFKPQLLLAGHGLGEDWKTTFQNFWSDYRIVCGDHPIFSHPEFDHRTCIPYFIHGDEGRGQLKRPYMVISWQCAIGHGGIQTINDNSHLVRLDLSLSFFFTIDQLKGNGVHQDVVFVVTIGDQCLVSCGDLCFPSTAGILSLRDGSSVEFHLTCTTTIGPLMIYLQNLACKPSMPLKMGSVSLGVINPCIVL